jgi:uncharacterized protein YndB with AHSA1/START domain
MAYTVEQSVLIDRPPEDVWEHVTTRDAWRRPYIVEVRDLDGGAPEPGSRYEDVFEVMGQKGTVINVLTEVDPPHRMAWTQPEKKGPVYVTEGHYELTEEDGKTRFTLSNTYEMPGLWKVLKPVIRRQSEKTAYPTMLRQLKEHLESEGNDGDSAPPASA